MEYLLKLVPALLILTLTTATAGPTAPVAAQDGLNAEQRTLLDRVNNAWNARETFDSYIAQSVQTSTTTMHIDVGDAITLTAESVAIETHAYHNADNVRATLCSDVSGHDPETGPYAYQLTAEVRLVGGVLYAQAERESQYESNLPAMPEGWVLVDNVQDWPALTNLDLGDFLADHMQATIYDYPDIIFKSTVDVFATPHTLPDGTRVELITVVLDGGALATALQDSAMMSSTYNAGLVALYAEIDPESTLNLTFTLDEDGQLLQRQGQTQMTWPDLDMSIVNANVPEGTIFFNLETSGTVNNQISAVNEPQEPVVAPVLE